MTDNEQLRTKAARAGGAVYSGNHCCGTCFALTKTKVVTCMHVLPNRYENLRIVWNRDGYDSYTSICTRVIPSNGEPDIALIELAEPLDDIFLPFKLGSYDCHDSHFYSYGYRESGKEKNTEKPFLGMYLDGNIIAKLPESSGARIQISSTDLSKGMSGAPIISGNVIVGMIRTAPTSDSQSLAGFAIPTDTIIRFCNDPAIPLVTSEKLLSERLLDFCREKISRAYNAGMTIAKTGIEAVLYPQIIDDTENIELEFKDNQTALEQWIRTKGQTAKKPLLVLGEGGIGKTVTMLGTCRDMLGTGTIICIYVPIRELEINRDKGFIQTYVENRILKRSPLYKHYLNNIKLPICYLLDGLNELPFKYEREVNADFYDEVKALSQAKNTIIVISSRRTPEEEGTNNFEYLRLSMKRLPWENKIKPYLKQYNVPVPDRKQMSEVLGLPLMLKLYITIKRTELSPTPKWMSLRKSMMTSSDILWNYVQLQIYKHVEETCEPAYRDLELLECLIACNYLAPYFASRMNANNKYDVRIEQSGAIPDYFIEGFHNFTGDNYSDMPINTIGYIWPSLNRVCHDSRGRMMDSLISVYSTWNRLIELGFIKEENDHAISDNENIDQYHIQFSHQDFQDIFHLIFLEEAQNNPDVTFYKEAYTQSKLTYDVVSRMADSYSDQQIAGLKRLIADSTTDSRNFGTYNLVELIKRAYLNDLSNQDFTDFDLTHAELNNCRFSNIANTSNACFHHAKIGVRTFSDPGHNAPVTAVSWHPQGSRLVSASYDTSLKIWNVMTEELLYTLRDHTHYVRCVSWSPDGKYIASGGDDRHLRIWKYNDKNNNWSLFMKATEALPGWIYAICWHPDSNGIFCGDSHGNLFEYSLTGERWECKKLIHLQHRYPIKKIQSFYVNDTLTVMSCFPSEGIFYLQRSIEKGSLMTKYIFGKIICFAWTNDKSTLALSLGDAIYIYYNVVLNDFSSMDKLEERANLILRKHCSNFTGMEWAEELLVLIDAEKLCAFNVRQIYKLCQKNGKSDYFWDDSSDNCILMNGHVGYVNDIKWDSYDLKGALASSSMDCSIRIWHPRNPTWNNHWTCTHLLPGIQLSVCHSTWSDNGRYIATGYGDNLIRIWDVVQNVCSLILHGHRASVKCLVWISEDFLASGSNDSDIRLWNLKSGESRVLYDHSGPVNTLLWLPKNKILLSGSDDNKILAYKISGQASISSPIRLVGHTNRVYSLSANSSESFIASVGNDLNLIIWDTRLLKTVSDNNIIEPTDKVLAHDREIRCVSWSPTENLVCTGGNDNEIHYWDIDENGGIHPDDICPSRTYHTDFVYGCEVSPNGQFLATGSTDTSVGIIDLKSRELVLRNTWHSDFVWQVTWKQTKEGLFLATNSSDGTLKIWRVNDATYIPKCEGYRTFRALPGTDIVGCDFSGAEFENEELREEIRINGGRV